MSSGQTSSDIQHPRIHYISNQRLREPLPAATMAQAGGSALAMAMLAVCALATIVSGAEATTFNVGGDNGWTLPSSAGGYNYSTWAANYTYHTGDKLFFKYSANAHNVLSVTGADFNNCTFGSPLTNDNGVGNYTFNLDKEGNYWFLCSFGNGKHCQAGMKFKVAVASGASASISRALPALVGALAILAYFLV